MPAALVVSVMPVRRMRDRRGNRFDSRLDRLDRLGLPPRRAQINPAADDDNENQKSQHIILQCGCRRLFSDAAQAHRTRATTSVAGLGRLTKRCLIVPRKPRRSNTPAIGLMPRVYIDFGRR